MNRLNGAKKVGKFSVTFDVANDTDIANVQAGKLAPDKIRRQTIKGIVDCGATMLVLPQSIANQLGLRVVDKIGVRYADGRKATRSVMGTVNVVLLGRQTTLSALIEPHRRTALIGAIVLEALDLLVDCKHQRLVPRNPRQVVHEIEDLFVAAIHATLMRNTSSH